MNILILTASHPYKTAGIVAFDLYKGLKLNDDLNVKILTRSWDRYNNEDIISINSKYYEYGLKILRLLRKIIINILILPFIYPKKNKTNHNYAFLEDTQSKTYYKTSRLLNRVNFAPHAIIVLFMPGFLSFKNLYELNKITKAPILLYMMDMSPLTGGCHYAWDCKGYLSKCGNCPGLFSNKEHDQSRKNWEFKKTFIDKTEIIILHGNKYSLNQINQSSLFKDKPKKKVPLSIDDKIFRPANKLDAKNYFKLPIEKRIIFFGAVNIWEKRKGFAELQKALEIVKENYKNDDLHIAIAGNLKEELSKNFPFNYTILGNLTHLELSKAFQAAYLFVCPSIEDSGPMMINQSIMCGTPVVAFEMGSAIDMVVSNETGYLAKLMDIPDLANGITEILALDFPTYLRMCSNCRYKGLETNHLQKQIKALLETFNYCNII